MLDKYDNIGKKKLHVENTEVSISTYLSIVQEMLIPAVNRSFRNKFINEKLKIQEYSVYRLMPSVANLTSSLHKICMISRFLHFFSKIQSVFNVLNFNILDKKDAKLQLIS